MGCVAIETWAREENVRMTKEVHARGGKIFAHLMSTSGRTLRNTETRVEDPILLTQVSCQSRYYKPEVPRNVCGNWLIGLGARPTLDQLADAEWTSVYYAKTINDIKTFSGAAAFSFISQSVYGFFSTAGWANPRKIYWYNNYGLRDMHPSAGGVTYHWGPNYVVATFCLINVVTVDGRTCITLASSVIPQGELEECAAELKRRLIQEAAAGGPGAEKKKLK